MLEYPLSEKHPEKLKTPSGVRFEDISLDAVMNGSVTVEDLRVRAETLELQAQIAEDAGRRQLSQNLRRASELICLSEGEILSIYEALRPGRSTKEQLLQIAGQLEEKYKAHLCAALLREAAHSREPHSISGTE